MQQEYTIDWGERKVSKYGVTFEGSFVRLDGSTFDATISQKDKQGVEFPNFDQLSPGRKILGNEWKSPTKGTFYIFAPKVATGRTVASRGSQVANRAASNGLDKKIDAIHVSQDRKEIGIKLASAMNGGIQLAIAEMSGTSDKSALASRIMNWRNWIIDHWGDEKDIIDPLA